VDCSCLAQDRDRWMALVNTVMDLGICKILEFFNLLEAVNLLRRTLVHEVKQLVS
jgi:hypothetical protein